MQKSATISNLAAALAKAQADFPAIPRDKTVTVQTRTGGSYKFAYAPLDTIMQQVRPTLKLHGLAFMQCLNGEALTTTLVHSSGEWMESDPMPIRVVDQGSQALGSAITYARRYALTALLGLVTEDDDDGNAADGNTATATSKIKPNADAIKMLSKEEQAKAKKIGNEIVDLWTEGKELAAYEKCYQSGHSNEVVLGIWEVLEPHSAIRSKLKKMDKEPSLRKVAA